MTWVDVARVDDLPDRAGARVDVGDHRLALFKIDDAVYAIGDRCSHAEASLSEGEIDGTEVECPLHGAIFDLMTGSAESLPATRPVPSYRVKVEDGDVFVELESR